MKNRRDIIKYICNNLSLTKSYLELGLRDPTAVFNHIPCYEKHSVDLNCDSTFKMSTDIFFNNLEESKLSLPNDFKWDIIFIDANHLANYVYSDFKNSLRHLSENGVIIFHDVLPHSYESQLEMGGNQTAWKVVPHILKNYKYVHICTLPEVDGGLGIAYKAKERPRNLMSSTFNPFYEYYVMNEDREYSQNVIKFDELLSFFENPFYHFDKRNYKNTDKYLNIYKKIVK